MKRPNFKGFLSFCLAILTVLSLAVPGFAAEEKRVYKNDPILCTPEQEETIWNYLLELTGNPISAAGIMGNLFYESHLDPENLQTMGKPDPDTGDKTYTEAVDDGSYTRFTRDGFGYGIAQWTYGGRKRRLLDIAHEQEKSISDLSVQLQLLGEELDRYHMLFRISNATTIDFVCDYFMTHFENPQDQSKEALQMRIDRGKAFYDKHFLFASRELTEAQKSVVDVAKKCEENKGKSNGKQFVNWAAYVYEKAGLILAMGSKNVISPEKYQVSDDFSTVPVGATVYGRVSSNEVYVGIYAGDNLVYHSTPKGIVSEELSQWIANYRGFCWGWEGGNDLTELE